MGAQESSQANLLTLLSSANMQNIDFNRIGELAKLVQGHEHEVFAFLTELMMSSKSSTTALNRIHNLQDWDKIQKLLPVIVQWVSKNKIDADSIKNIDADDLVKKLARFMKNPNQQDAIEMLQTSFHKQLITPPNSD